MTREEKLKAIDALKISAPVKAVTQEEFNDYIQTLNKVMDWLEQEPCEDCISRQMAIDAFERFIHELGIEDEPYNYGEMALSVRNVPSVTPKPTECEDAVSRQKVAEVLLKYAHSTEGKAFAEFLISQINALPPVTPKPRTGKWIRHDTGHSIYYDCSLCGCAAPCTETADKILWKMANYCPDCGAIMLPVD